jgi:hypothetical protein
MMLCLSLGNGKRFCEVPQVLKAKLMRAEPYIGVQRSRTASLVECSK